MRVFLRIPALEQWPARAISVFTGYLTTPFRGSRKKSAAAAAMLSGIADRCTACFSRSGLFPRAIAYSRCTPAIYAAPRIRKKLATPPAFREPRNFAGSCCRRYFLTSEMVHNPGALLPVAAICNPPRLRDRCTK